MIFTFEGRRDEVFGPSGCEHGTSGVRGGGWRGLDTTGPAQHPPGEAVQGGRRTGPTGPGQGRVPQPGWFGEGPDRVADDRVRGGRRAAGTGWHDRRADVRQHRGRPGPGRPAARVLLHLRLPGQGQPGQAGCPQGLRRAGRRLPDRCSPRASRLLLLRVGSARPRDRRRLETQPVRQPRRPGQPLRHYRPRDLGGYGRTGHPPGRRSRYRRDHHRETRWRSCASTASRRCPW
jgi:hypothetical protein